MSSIVHAPRAATASPTHPNRPETAVSGDYACRGCGYRISSFGTLPRCPMCACGAWDQLAWRPFSQPS